MNRILLIGIASTSLAFGTVLARAQETPREVVATYESLADTILAVKSTEDHFVRSMLQGLRQEAETDLAAGDFQKAAAEMALFANEGDNAIAGVRKRLLEGGHHHNAEGESMGVYEPGYVVVTKEAKAKALAASAALRQAGDEGARKKAWADFVAVSDALLRSK